MLGMKKYDSTAIRNVAFLGHGDSGKTSLVSALLFNSGTVNRLGSVNDGSSITDFNDDEINRKISISTALAFAEYRDHKINLIDTPGFANFIHEAKAALPVADAGLIAVCAVSGVEVMTERVYRYCREQHKPTAFVVNKIDRDNANFFKVLAEIQEVFDRRAVAVQIPMGEESSFKGVIDLVTMKAYVSKGDGSKDVTVSDIPAEFKEKADEMHNALQEMIAENDEELMEHFFEAGELTVEEMSAGLRRATISRQLFPVFCASATKNVGITQLLETFVNLFPNPLERGEIAGMDPATRAEKIRKTAPDAPFMAYVFKTVVDPFTGRINLFRVYSGSVGNDASVFNVNRDMNEKLSHMMIMQGKKGEQVEGLSTGDIGAVAKLRETHTGDVFCDAKDRIIFEPVTFPEPVFSYALEPKSRADEEKISSALQRLQEEDIMLRSERDPQTKELLVRGTGQLHIEVIVERLKNKFNCDVILHPPKIAYRETINGTADVRARHKKQSGGRGQFAECAIKLEPNERGKGYEFIDQIFGGSIPLNFRPAVDKGIQETVAKGVIAGYPVVDVKVILYDGKDHPVDSSEMAFKTAGSMAFKEAMRKAKPVLLEPVMNVDITIPEDNTGDIMGDLSTRRGRPMGMDPGPRGTVIKAQVPMAEMLTYGADLTSITGGRGSFTMEFSHYDIVPGNIADKIIAQAKVHEEEEE
jgi:elongation factor G